MNVFVVAVQNPCADQNGGCVHECRADGGKAHCDCKAGYILAEDGKTCQGKFTIHKNWWHLKWLFIQLGVNQGKKINNIAAFSSCSGAFDLHTLVFSQPRKFTQSAFSSKLINFSSTLTQKFEDWKQQRNLKKVELAQFTWKCLSAVEVSGTTSTFKAHGGRKKSAEVKTPTSHRLMLQHYWV